MATAEPGPILRSPMERARRMGPRFREDDPIALSGGGDSWHGERDRHHALGDCGPAQPTFRLLARPIIGGAHLAASTARETGHETRNMSVGRNPRRELRARHALAGAQPATPAAGNPCSGRSSWLLRLRGQPSRPVLSLPVGDVPPLTCAGERKHRKREKSLRRQALAGRTIPACPSAVIAIDGLQELCKGT